MCSESSFNLLDKYSLCPPWGLVFRACTDMLADEFISHALGSFHDPTGTRQTWMAWTNLAGVFLPLLCMFHVCKPCISWWGRPSSAAANPLIISYLVVTNWDPCMGLPTTALGFGSKYFSTGPKTCMKVLPVNQDKENQPKEQYWLIYLICLYALFL